MPFPRAPPHKNLTSKKPQAALQSLSPVVKPPPHDQQQLSLKCPRCDSSSTKFCYYNNYSFSQPRHFCKTCRRYWTNGGALRNVPVGGGSRKTKRLKSSSSSSKEISVELNGLKLSRVVSPTLNFQLGGIEIPRVNTPYALTEGIYDSSQFPVLWGLNFPPPMVIPPPKHPMAPSSSASPPSSGEPVSMKTDSNLMSTIESLSCINQDLHWKLQQQRLAALFRSAPQQENVTDGNNNSGPPAMEWFFGKSSSYTSVTPSPTDNNHGNENMSCNNWHHSSSDNNNNGNSKGEAAVIRHHQGWGC